MRTPTAPSTDATTCRSLCCLPQPVSVIDVESTGTDPLHDRIIEVSVRQLLPASTQRKPEPVTYLPHTHYTTLIDPGHELHGSGIHGITDQMLTGQPRFTDVAASLRRLLDGTVIVGHGVEHDLCWLNTAWERVGVAPLRSHRWMCTRQSAATLGIPLSHSRLSEVAAWLGIDVTTVHRADSDTATTVAVFTALLHRSFENEGHLPSLGHA